MNSSEEPTALENAVRSQRLSEEADTIKVEDQKPYEPRSHLIIFDKELGSKNISTLENSESQTKKRI